MPTSHFLVLRALNLWFKLVPLSLISKETIQQVLLKRRFFPAIPFRLSVMRYRNWGQDVSLALTPIFQVELDEVFPGVEREIEACSVGGRTADEYYRRWAAETGHSPEFASERRRRTEELLRVPPEDVFSEVQITAEGRLRIRDGHHRAGLARLHGRYFHNVVITVKINHK